MEVGDNALWKMAKMFLSCLKINIVMYATISTAFVLQVKSFRIGFNMHKFRFSF